MNDKSTTIHAPAGNIQGREKNDALLFAGIPYAEPALSNSTTGGTPYGASHVEAESLSEDEIKICRTQGKRIAQLSTKLNH